MYGGAVEYADLPPALDQPGLPVAADSALHLLRRTTHGPAPADWLALTAAGSAAKWLDGQLTDAPDEATDAEVRVRFPLAEVDPLVAQTSMGGSFDSRAMEQVGYAHLFRQLVSPRQLFEQVVDVFANLLNVPVLGEAGVWSLPSYSRDVIRANAFGRYATMLGAAATHGAMLDYLGASSSTKHEPNENLGRELLELHSVGTRAHYTERDVRNSTLALTGMTTDPALGGAATYNKDWHYTGSLRVLGWHHANKDAAAGQAVVTSLTDYLARHPSCAYRVSRALAVRFVSDNPPPDLLAAMVKAYQAADTGIVPTLRAMFGHRAFGKSVGAKLRRPHQQALAVARALGVSGAAAPTADGIVNLFWTLRPLGDAPLAHPSPEGNHDTALDWLTTGSRLASTRWATGAIYGWGKGLTTPSALDLRPTDAHATGGAVWLPTTPLTATQVIQACSRRLLGHPLPAAQVKTIATAARLSTTAPPVALSSYDAALPIVFTLLASHPGHAVR